MSPTVALQIIQTTWTKESRGGRGAQLRNTVPHALPFEAKAGKFNAQLHFFDESNNFNSPAKPPSLVRDRQVCELKKSFVFEWFHLLYEWNDESQSSHLVWSNMNRGAPAAVFLDNSGNQKPIRRDTLAVVNAWIRLRWMERFSDLDTGQWWYHHTVVNLAQFDYPIDFNVFLRGAPTQEFCSLPILR